MREGCWMVLRGTGCQMECSEGNSGEGDSMRSSSPYRFVCCTRQLLQAVRSAILHLAPPDQTDCEFRRQLAEISSGCRACGEEPHIIDFAHIDVEHQVFHAGLFTFLQPERTFRLRLSHLFHGFTAGYGRFLWWGSRRCCQKFLRRDAKPMNGDTF